MKLTVEISDLLLKQARRLASKEYTTLKALVQEGLRRLIAARSPKPFKLRKVSFKGKGLHPEMADVSWERIRDAIYEGHGA
ncbi:MAG: type II toxin-antitoxin system VapB family antitoxin [Terriglobia bacterium]|jgi:mRNA-degrading endonuclease RelE of RelBE toxin-antitoxin system